MAEEEKRDEDDARYNADALDVAFARLGFSVFSSEHGRAVRAAAAEIYAEGPRKAAVLAAKAKRAAEIEERWRRKFREEGALRAEQCAELGLRKISAREAQQKAARAIAREAAREGARRLAAPRERARRREKKRDLRCVSCVALAVCTHGTYITVKQERGRTHEMRFEVHTF